MSFLQELMENPQHLWKCGKPHPAQGNGEKIHPPLDSAADSNESAMDSNGHGRSFTVKTASKQKTTNGKINLQMAIKHLYLCLFTERERKPYMPQEKMGWELLRSVLVIWRRTVASAGSTKHLETTKIESHSISWEKIANGMLKWPQQADGV